jgi:hypothetical protein
VLCVTVRFVIASSRTVTSLLRTKLEPEQEKDDAELLLTLPDSMRVPIHDLEVGVAFLLLSLDDETNAIIVVIVARATA